MTSSQLMGLFFLAGVQNSPAHQEERPDHDQGNVQTRLEAARGHEETAARPPAMGQGKDKGNHLQEVEETEEEEGGTSAVPRPEEKEGGLDGWTEWRIQQKVRDAKVGKNAKLAFFLTDWIPETGHLLNPATYYLERRSSLC